MTAPANPGPTTPEHPPGLGAPLKIPEFRRFYTVLSVAMLAGWINSVACSWQMTLLNDAAVMQGLVQASYTLPGLFFALPGGVLADKVDRTRYLLTLNTLLAGVGISLTALAATGLITPTLLLLHTLIMGTVFSLQSPAMMAVVQDLVKRDLLAQALTLNSIALNVGRAVGPAIAGAIIGAFNVAVALVANVVAYGLMALYFLRLPRPELKVRLREGFIEALWNGLKFAASERRFRGILVRFFLFLSCMSALMALMPLVAKTSLGGGPGTFGTLITWVGIGSVLSAFSRGRLSGRITPDIHVYLSAVIGTIAYLGIAATSDIRIASAMAFLFGVAWTNSTITFQVAAQIILPASMQGRGISLFMMTFSSGMMSGGLLWGGIADVIGLRDAITAAGIGILALTLATWRMRLATASD
ncbi:MAG: MFS transporter [Alphaproteobacteria bacterium]|nr:MFS transporter [Alphaproteobacteria bacterium]